MADGEKSESGSFKKLKLSKEESKVEKKVHRLYSHDISQEEQLIVVKDKQEIRVIEDQKKFEEKNIVMGLRSPPLVNQGSVGRQDQNDILIENHIIE